MPAYMMKHESWYFLIIYALEVLVVDCTFKRTIFACYKSSDDTSYLTHDKYIDMLLFRGEEI